MDGTQVEVASGEATLVASNKGTATKPHAITLRVPSGGQTVYLGGPGVTDATGFPLEPGENISLDLVNEQLYAIVSSDTQILHRLQRG